MPPAPQPPTTPMSGSMRADIRAEMNRIILQLASAGVQLHGKFKWHMLEPYWNPAGFDFMCENAKGLQQAAENASQLAPDFSDMPGYDAWATGGVTAAGYSQIGKKPYVHLDIAVNRPGLCRLYLVHGGPLHRDTLRMAVSSYANHPIVRKVSRVIALLRLPLHRYGITVTKIYGGANSPEPEGFDFDVVDAEGLLRDAAAIGPLARDDVRTPEGRVSAAVTLGTGYREVGYGPRIHLEVEQSRKPGAKNGKGNVHIDLEGWVIGKNERGAAIYDWVHGITHHFPEDLLPGYLGRPLVGKWRGIEWRPSVGVEHGRAHDEKDSHWRAYLGFRLTF